MPCCLDRLTYPEYLILTHASAQVEYIHKNEVIVSIAVPLSYTQPYLRLT
jgi:hypothetical protein